ncbi:hypothetical protein C5C95_05760 [Rathayibacter sp. AY1B7]|uniref:RNA polymerase sigma factor n=1 Tax=Rathayibacter sp. AY1B7 TaxID=2080532 RepID=UPI000CE7727C|nr:RNA polymerase sigma factor [Rathayibacter sp. AY1B7]PPI00079.1 hypothetical protein C5C95_05760 [Rathayibacter sp. AY1B7]
MGVEWETDREVWRRATGADPRAFALIFDRYHLRVRAYCRQLLGESVDAEDAAVVVFLEAWRKRADVRFVNDSLAAWLLVVALNVTRNIGRGRRRYERMLRTLPPPVNAPDPAVTVAAAAASAERSRTIRAALTMLRPADQQILALCVIEQLTLEEAAAVLRIPVGTVKSRLSRARGRLRDEFTRRRTLPHTFRPAEY